MTEVRRNKTNLAEYGTKEDKHKPQPLIDWGYYEYRTTYSWINIRRRSTP